MLYRNLLSNISSNEKLHIPNCIVKEYKSIGTHQGNAVALLCRLLAFQLFFIHLLFLVSNII